MRILTGSVKVETGYAHLSCAAPAGKLCKQPDNTDQTCRDLNGGEGEGAGPRGRTWWEGLLELVGLVGIEDAERVEVPGAANLELDGVLGPLDPHRPRVLPARRQQEVLDLVDLLRHGGRLCKPEETEVAAARETTIHYSTGELTNPVYREIRNSIVHSVRSISPSRLIYVCSLTHNKQRKQKNNGPLLKCTHTQVV